MNVAQINMDELDIDLPNAKLAYTIIQSLLQSNASGPAASNLLPGGKLWAGLRRHAWASLTLWFAIVLAGTAMTSS